MNVVRLTPLIFSAALIACVTAFGADEGLPTAAPTTGQPSRAVAAAAPVPITPTPGELLAIQAKLAELNAAIHALKEAKANDELIVDAESCAWVVHNLVRVPGGFISQDAFNRCIPILEDGLRRAAEIKAGTAAWPQVKGRVNRAYRSSVDGTAQPYHLNIPASYDPAKPIPLFVYLHGRSPHNPDLGHTWVGGNDRPSETASVINASASTGPAYIRVEAFGRGNNSFRFAGETDVLEVIAAIEQRYNIDRDRIILAGFSMGGAGAWQLGLRMPDLFCGLEINAGVIGNRLNTDGLSLAEKAAAAPYGLTIPHALAVANLPLVGFAGENDAQLAASTSIREQLGREGYAIEKTGPYVWRGKDINALFLIHPAQGHAHPTGETKRLRDEFTAANLARGRVVPDHIRFVTHTTRYSRSHWVTIDGLQQHFERATIHAQRDAAKSSFTITTHNISRLILTETSAAKKVSIDGDVLSVEPANRLLLVRADGHWKAGDLSAPTALRKRPALQGPIADAFFSAFLCVTPTGKANHALAAERAKQEQERFAKMFAREYAGEARAKHDTAVTAEDIATHNLVLFGDPGSNALLARIADQLPIRWTKESIVVGEKTYRAADHVPVLIYPNPLNPNRYVVINTGLPPQGRGSAGLGDFAVLKLTAQADGQLASEAAAEGVFDESWQLPASTQL